MVVNDIQHMLQYCADQKLDKSYDRKLQESTHLNYDNHYKLLGIQIPGDLDLFIVIIIYVAVNTLVWNVIIIPIVAVIAIGHIYMRTK